MATKGLAHFCLPITFFLITGLAQAQQATKLSRVGVLRLGSPPDPLIDAFRDALSKLGYVEGQNVVMELRYTRAKAGQLQELATDLVRKKVDVIVAPGGTAARIAKGRDQDDTDCRYSRGRSRGRRARIEPRPTRWKRYGAQQPFS
jgi:ABC-type uncharacterized transport system substrate-binding protein